MDTPKQTTPFAAVPGVNAMFTAAFFATIAIQSHSAWTAAALHGTRGLVALAWGVALWSLGRTPEAVAQEPERARKLRRLAGVAVSLALFCWVGGAWVVFG